MRRSIAVLNIQLIFSLLQQYPIFAFKDIKYFKTISFLTLKSRLYPNALLPAYRLFLNIIL
ncbi:hypothetical protein SAMN05421882_100588 [Nitrosomonas communis]|uniref:Uncharacterized protein n=1 Tax=Nitrosomonas communis TaxID=44574 RepID=A0A1H2RV62_9PROT|nr:hypothetical protein SAMN05421882_100588 [Nitrosomonas communis]